MRITEKNLRMIIREELLTEAKINYPGGYFAISVFVYWQFKIRSNFKVINGRWPTYGEYADLIESSMPGFKFKYSSEESPSDVLEDISRGTPGLEFLANMHKQIWSFNYEDDKRDQPSARGLERTALHLQKKAEAITKPKASGSRADAKRRAEEYEATYEPKAPPDSPLGKYAFSPQRQHHVSPPPMEKNNPTEATLLRSIRNHIVRGLPLTQQQAQLVTSFIRDGLYPDVFREAQPGTYYRGMALGEKALKRMGVDVTKMDPQIIKNRLEGNFEIKPRGNSFSSSWSYSFNVAESFSLGGGDGREDEQCAVIFAASTEDNPGKFLEVKKFYGLDFEGLKGFSGEEEVISLGTIRAKWVQISWL